MSAQGPLDDIHTIRQAIDAMADRLGDAPFLIDATGAPTVTFAQLRGRAETIGRRLHSLGLAKGDRVALLRENSPATAVLLLGAMYAGLVAVPLDPAGGRTQLRRIIEHAGPRLVFASATHEDVLGAAESRRPTVMRVDPPAATEWGVEAVPRGERPALHGDDDALLIYTSGSTGEPKGILASHRNVVCGARNTVEAHRLSSADRALLVLPLHHMNALIITLLPTLLSGGATVIPSRFSVAAFWRWVVDLRCTWFALVPTIIAQLLSWSGPEREERAAALRHVRFARSSAAPLAPALHRAFEERFGLPLIEALGNSEAVSVVFSNPLPPAPRKIGSPGIPWGFEVRVVDADGFDLPAGRPGDIVIRGPSVMKGYHRDAQATAAALDQDGWLRLGDVGRRDEDGYFFITGRRGEIIIRGGENIALRQIDDALAGHPAVLEAAAVGVPDEYLGEDVVVYVVRRAGEPCTEQALVDFCERELGEAWRPSRVYFVEDLPKGPAGKVLRLRLREQAERDRGATPGGRGITAAAGGGPGSADDDAPWAPVERTLGRIWADVLGLERIGVRENFFALGGTSLQAGQILSRVRHALGADVTLSVFFDNPTIGQQAAVVDSCLAATEEGGSLLARLEHLSDTEVTRMLADDPERTPGAGPLQ